MLVCLLICSSAGAHAAIDGQEPTPRSSTTPTLQKERPASSLLHRGKQAFTQCFAGKPDRQGWAIGVVLIVSAEIVRANNLPALLREAFYLLNEPAYVFLGSIANLLNLDHWPGMTQGREAYTQYLNTQVGIRHNRALSILFIVLYKLYYAALYKASLQERTSWVIGFSLVSWWISQPESRQGVVYATLTCVKNIAGTFSNFIVFFFLGDPMLLGDQEKRQYKKSTHYAIRVLLWKICFLLLCKVGCDVLFQAGRAIASHRSLIKAYPLTTSWPKAR